METKIKKIPPLRCPTCGSVRVYKDEQTVCCEDCKRKHYLESGKIDDYEGFQIYGDGYDPWLDTGDYFE